MVVGAHYLGKAALSQNTLDLESIQYVVAWLYQEIAICIVHATCAFFKRTEINFVIQVLNFIDLKQS